MKTKSDIKTFDDLSEKYLTWIIKYCSPNFSNSLFLVWYTDTGENTSDKLLTYKSGEIFVIRSLADFRDTVLSIFNSLVVFNNLGSWLDNFNTLEVREFYTYDLISVSNALEKNILDTSTIENFTNFINLYDDFAKQNDSNSHLQIYTDNGLIKETCDYFYNYIFWPRFSDKEKLEAWNRPQLNIDTNELLLKLKDIIKAFDKNIKQIANH